MNITQNRAAQLHDLAPMINAVRAQVEQVNARIAQLRAPYAAGMRRNLTIDPFAPIVSADNIFNYLSDEQAQEYRELRARKVALMGEHDVLSRKYRDILKEMHAADVNIKQARKNEQERREMRSQMCQKCFCVHSSDECY